MRGGAEHEQADWKLSNVHSSGALASEPVADWKAHASGPSASEYSCETDSSVGHHRLVPIALLLILRLGHTSEKRDGERTMHHFSVHHAEEERSNP